MAKPNKTPAFPMNWGGGSGPDGMSMLDYFAGQALVGMGTWSPSTEFPLEHSTKARFAYDIAEAMIAERDRRNAE